MSFRAGFISLRMGGVEGDGEVKVKVLQWYRPEQE